MTHIHKISKNWKTDLGWPEAIWLYNRHYESQINTVTVRSFKIMLTDQIRGNRGRQERRDVSENPEGNQSISYSYKTWKWACLLIDNVICRHKEMKIGGKSWVIVEICPVWPSHIKLYILYVLNQPKIKSTVPSFLTDNIEIINKLYMKHCEENVQNQTISDTQRETESSHLCWLSCC